MTRYSSYIIALCLLRLLFKGYEPLGLAGTGMSPFCILLELRMTEVVVTHMTCKAPVKSSPPTNQHPVFTGRMFFLSPNQQCQSTEGKLVVAAAAAAP